MALWQGSRISFRQFGSFKRAPLFFMNRSFSSLQDELAEKIKHLPRRVNWVEEGVVGPVVHQGQKGRFDACWAYQTVNELNSIFQLATGKPHSFSVQELLDYSADDSRLQAQKRRGAHYSAFVGYRYGLSLEKYYPFVIEIPRKPNPFTRYLRTPLKIDAFGIVPPFREDYLKLAVASHPVIVSLLFRDSFHKYKEGIYRLDCKPDHENLGVHAILLVGYDVIDGKPVWLVQNCHGKRWGMNGFMYLPREVENSWENCYLAHLPVYPILNSFNKNLFEDLPLRDFFNFKISEWPRWRK